MENFLQNIIDGDRRVFSWINQVGTNSFFDLFFPAITDLHHQIWFLIPMFVFFIFIFRQMGTKAFFLFLLGLLTTVAVSDLTAYRILKANVERLRPPYVESEIQVRSVYRGKNSFPSNHATNSFAIAAFVGLIFPRSRKYLFPAAALISYSRIYCGVHYPLDVVAGGLWGSFLGWGIGKIWRKRIFKTGA
jgi:undecaprenyl-diphosphatase